MKLGELRDTVERATDAGTGQLGVRLPEHAEVVVRSAGAWLRVEGAVATFLRGRWTLLLETVGPGALMWGDEATTVVADAETNPLQVLADRKAERRRLTDHLLAEARKDAKTAGFTDICRNQAVTEHQGCPGVAARSNEFGCLCECHDSEIMRALAERVGLIPSSQPEPQVAAADDGEPEG